jgi:hypothetical protein
MKHPAHKKNRTPSDENPYDDPDWGKASHGPNQKAPTSKKELQAIRKRYTWHLRVPEFDCDHWWKRNASGDYKGIDPLAAWYEVVRRNPKVPEIPLEPLYIPGHVGSERFLQWYERLTLAEFLRFLGRHAMLSWEQLTKEQWEKWRTSIGKMKSFDQRSNDSISRNLTYSTYIAQLKALDENERQSRVTPLDGLFAMFGWLNFPNHAEWEKAISDEAVKAHREGRVLIAIEPHLAADKAVAAMKKAYLSHPYVDSTPVTRERARWQQWLDVIADFENSMPKNASPAKGNSQLFVRYRRVIDGVVFPDHSISAADTLRRPSPASP